MKFNNPSEPYPVFVKLPTGEMKEQSHHVCAHCLQLWYSREFAYDCCRQKKCSSCGGDIFHGSLCIPCDDKQLLAGAVEVPYAGTPLYDPVTGKYFEDLDGYLEEVSEKSRAEYLHPCNIIDYEGIDAETAIGMSMDWMQEDARDSLVDVDELKEFVSAWNKKQTLQSWEPALNTKIKVLESNNKK